ncbi:hypothetical protein CPB86DRAFT_111563 [Serendipita vermifera]|nr:hypothetical protein CPB86DRAFT_111563 [Serendipita vermifera]
MMVPPVADSPSPVFSAACSARCLATLAISSSAVFARLTASRAFFFVCSSSLLALTRLISTSLRSEPASKLRSIGMVESCLLGKFITIR